MHLELHIKRINVRLESSLDRAVCLVFYYKPDILFDNVVFDGDRVGAKVGLGIMG